MACYIDLKTRGINIFLPLKLFVNKLNSCQNFFSLLALNLLALAGILASLAMFQADGIK